MKISKYHINRLIAGAARFFSTVFTPLMMPTYGVFLVLWTSVLCLLPMGTRIMVLIMVLGITCVLPIISIGALHHFKIISNKQLDKQHERLYPYAFAVLCYIAAAFYLNNIHSPMWFVMFAAGGALACLLDMIINLWWKISAHMTGIGGIVALLFQIHVQGLSAFNLFWLLCLTILVAGVLGTSRMILKRHDLLQVLAGFAVGYFCVSFMIKSFG